MKLGISANCPACKSPLVGENEAMSVISEAEGAVVINGLTVALPESEFQVYECLSAGVVTRSGIYDRLYGLRPDSDQPDPKIVDVFVCKLRAKISPLGGKISSIWGTGYRLTIEKLTARDKTNILQRQLEEDTSDDLEEIGKLHSRKVKNALKFSEDIGEEPRFEWINLDLISVDDRYQRELDLDHAREIAENFKWDYFQPVTLAKRDDGTYVVVDGQHRWHAADLHPKVTEIPAYIISAADVEEEADVFVETNKTRLGVNGVDIYWASIAAEDQGYIAMRDLLESVGLEVVPRLGQSSKNKVACVKKLFQLQKRHGDRILANALLTLKASFPDSKDAFKAVYIEGVSNFIAENPDTDERIAAFLQKFNPATLDAKCRELRPGFNLRNTSEVLSKLLGQGLDSQVA